MSYQRRPGGTGLHGRQVYVQQQQGGPGYGNQLRRYNRYQDIELNAALMPHDEIGKFLRALSEEESKWLGRLGNRIDDDGVRSSALLWLRVPVNLSHLVPSLLGTASFKTHHATTDYIMFVKGPGNIEPQSLPLYGTHYARVECVVVDSATKDILVVHEQIGTMETCRKLVTGSVDPGEFVEDAAVREVMEETGIRAVFKGILGLVNRIGTRFGKDELLVGCLLWAEPAGQVPQAKSGEIKGVEWAKVEDVLRSGSNFMGRRWACAAANLGSCSSHEKGLEPHEMDDFRGRGHRMVMYAAL